MRTGPARYPELLAPSQDMEAAEELFHVLETGEGTGTAVVTGTLADRPFSMPCEQETREEGTETLAEKLSMLCEEEGRSVYIRVLRSDPAEFFEYFRNMAKAGNSINIIDGGTLLFCLGMLNDDGEFSSTAAVGEMARSKILTALVTGAPVELKLTIPLYAGTGAPAEFSFAGSIESIKLAVDKGGE